ncbi:AAA family ATPase [Nostoc spongiaeforme FACHB-130]|uniref:AAA family ATPase n=1 Tax=Nostoc spongiaeforme FACHB-130 TaxID=1357510 RepID=A0ABR8FWW5_9NOSO|nr:AAA family ATPase [Nostoc spongiaeforme]MBD2595920.1 AAA family ATPase [Nostoc spongiaeforme FACHB-130]
MFLQRIRVPDFRVLKNVDISFEKEFTPSIFPLGSLNGGGKSTLLQLIFILLHCSTHPDRIDFLKNITEGFKINQNSDKRVLAIIDIWDGCKTVELEFFLCTETFIKDLFKNVDNNDEVIEKIFSRLNENYEHKLRQYTEPKNEAHKIGGLSGVVIDKTEQDEYFDNKFTEYLNKSKLIHICDIYFHSEQNKYKKEILLCHVNNLDTNKIQSFLRNLSDKVFLAAPNSQIFLFFSQNSRKLLFKAQGENNYYLELKQEKIKLPGFFTYDFMAIDFLIKSFTQARDQDFIQAIKTGKYGDSYQALLNDLNSIFIDKKINLNEDLSGVIFKKNEDDVELYPEDLSHGELKRLFLYMLIKYNKIENAIVLMDEIEIYFHPDWQYQIVRDLEEWSPTNQYILATHSYDLCEAVTPAHVKLLPSKLINPNKSPSSEI